MSTRSARSKITKTPPTTELLDGDSSGEPKVNSGASSSLLSVQEQPLELQREWENDVRFHVSRHLLHLRRFRRVSQSRLAEQIGASQSQIARIESGSENITASTVERIANALDGRFEVRIFPRELALRPISLWWELPSAATNHWTLDHLDGVVGPNRVQIRLTFGTDIQNTLATGLYISAGAS
ncbi:MAG: helix-turn-helix transcriptional regulator [Vicinamibacterales bacterium]